MRSKTKNSFRTRLLAVTLILGMTMGQLTCVSGEALEGMVSENALETVSENSAETTVEDVEQTEISDETTEETTDIEDASEEVVEEDVTEISPEMEISTVSGNTTDTPIEKPLPNKVTNLSVKKLDYNKVQLDYSITAEAEGYHIYCSDSQFGTYNLLTTANGAYNVSVTKDGLTVGAAYFFKVCAYNEDQGKVREGEMSDVVCIKMMLDTPVITSVKCASYKSNVITYDKVTGANGYEIYRSTTKKGTYKKIGTVKKGSKVSFTDKKSDTGVKYYYKVKAYRNVNGKKVRSEFSKYVMGKAVLDKVAIKDAEAISATSVFVTWKKVKGATGYAIYRSTEKKGTYKKIATFNGNKTVSGVVDGQENGYTYYYKVRALAKMKNKKLTYGDYSKVKAVPFKFFTYAGETYEEKSQRVFGTSYYQEYSSKEVADANQSTIVIQVWDINKLGMKYTKNVSLTVNKGIAPSVQQIFKEIYEGDEKFPIKAIGGYSWRGDASTSEHCEGLAIDINPNENYMIEGNGTISSGSFWSPGTSPYSIPSDGEVVKIFEKYGFGWGGWGWSSGRRDYMHFSYYGG